MSKIGSRIYDQIQIIKKENSMIGEVDIEIHWKHKPTEIKRVNKFVPTGNSMTLIFMDSNIKKMWVIPWVSVHYFEMVDAPEVTEA